MSFQQFKCLDQGKDLLLQIGFNCQTGGNVLWLLDPQLVFDVLFGQGGAQGSQSLLILGLGGCDVGLQRPVTSIESRSLPSAPLYAYYSDPKSIRRSPDHPGTSD